MCNNIIKYVFNLKGSMTLVNVIFCVRNLFRKCTDRTQSVMSYLVWPEVFIDYRLKQAPAVSHHKVFHTRVFKTYLINLPTSIFTSCQLFLVLHYILHFGDHV